MRPPPARSDDRLRGHTADEPRRPAGARPPFPGRPAAACWCGPRRDCCGQRIQDSSVEVAQENRAPDDPAGNEPGGQPRAQPRNRTIPWRVGRPVEQRRRPGSRLARDLAGRRGAGGCLVRDGQGLRRGATRASRWRRRRRMPRRSGVAARARQPDSPAFSVPRPTFSPRRRRPFPGASSLRWPGFSTSRSSLISRTWNWACGQPDSA